MRQIIVDISPTGETKVTTRGFFGAACKAASKWLEDLLGKRTSETLTAEYHQTESHRSEVKQ